MYDEIFKIGAKARDKYNQAQLTVINEAVELFKQRIMAVEKQAKGDKFKVYNDTKNEALTIIPENVLTDVISDCGDGSLFPERPLTSWEAYELHMQIKEHYKNKKRTRREIAKLVANYVFDMAVSVMSGAIVDKTEDENVKNIIEASEAMDIVSEAEMRSMQRYINAQMPKSSVIQCRNIKLFKPAADAKAVVKPTEITADDIADMTSSGLSGWLDELLGL